MIHIWFEMPQGDDKGLAVAEVLRNLADRIEYGGVDDLAEGEGVAVVDVMFQTIGWARIGGFKRVSGYKVVSCLIECDHKMESYHNTFESARKAAREDLNDERYGDSVKIIEAYRYQYEETIETLTRGK